ncbi:MAG: TetR/AcrR family transcriptional regulator [Chloroflexi bacterium]|nr:TetR/AcrR family transcriptional regulator [Chloroflexota bacterium]
MSINARDSILAAAAQLISREGARRLTLDAVAAEARLSKGGLLYHFSSKDDLIRGLVETLVAQFDAEVETFTVPGKPGAWTRAYLDAAINTSAAASESHASKASAGHGPALTSTGIAAAVSNNPALLEPVREAYRRWQQNLESDGIDPVDATIVRLACDGLWLSDLIGLDPVPEPLQTAVVSRMRAMTTSADLTETVTTFTEDDNPPR